MINFSTPSFSIKNIIMSVAALYAIGLSIFLMYNTLRIATPINQYGTIAVMNNAPETSEKTYCESDTDCWCRNFDGAKFIEGKTASICNMEAGKCQKCMYR